MADEDKYDFRALIIALLMAAGLLLILIPEAKCQAVIVDGRTGRVIDPYSLVRRDQRPRRKKRRKARRRPRPVWRPVYLLGPSHMDNRVYDWSRHSP